MANLQNIQTEVDAAFLYDILAKNESDAELAKIFAEMSAIEMSHAIAFLTKSNLPSSSMPKPSFQARLLERIGKIMGYDYILGTLLDTEKKLAHSVLKSRNQHNLPSSLSDTAHVTILENIISKSKSPTAQISRFEKRHKSVGGNALRAAVLGGNDGLVSNFSLIMGVAGATSGRQEILLAGLAGLLAGALSMALGEWISVQSSKELYEHQMALELDELETNPEGEYRELVLIYTSKGIPQDTAEKMARDLIDNNKAEAYSLLVKEELGIDAEELKGSAMEAAVASFVLFAVGAIIPLFPFFFLTGYTAILLSVACSAIGLFVIGSIITLFTGKSLWYSGMRQVLFGLIAAAITFGIGKWIGVSLG
jgi:vacuolar iron transporter family protein